MIEEGIMTFKPVSASTGEEIKLSMQRLFLSGKIIPVGAYLIVEHVFVSSEKKPLEVIYSFGLPRDAALRRFVIKGENFTVESDLKTIKEINKIYEEAIEKGHLAAKAQEYRDGIVNLTVGNIKPGEEVRVYLEIISGVETNDKNIRFRFPFSLAPCYHPQARYSEISENLAEIELPEDKFGDVILPTYSKNAENLHEIGFNMKVDFPVPIKRISSPSHSIEFLRHDEEKYSISLAREKDIPNRDLVLEIETDKIAPYTFAEKARDNKIHFVEVLPSELFDKKQKAERLDIVFVLDRSGSMGGLPIQQAKRAVKACLSALDKEDNFSLIAFDDVVEVFEKTLKPATKANRDNAFLFLDHINARGGTELRNAIIEAAKMLKSADCPTGKILVFTDGQVYGTEEIIETARKNNIELYCIGIGSASQDRFLNLLTRETGGKSIFITLNERIEVKSLELFNSIKTNLGKVINIQIKNEKKALIDKDLITSLSQGSPFIVFGEAESEGEYKLEVKIRKLDKAELHEFPVKITSVKEGDSIRLIKGSRLISEAETYYTSDSNGANQTLKKIEELSKKYGLASRAMGLVAVVKRETDKEGELPTTKVVPVGMPEGVEWESYFRADLDYAPQMLGFSKKRASFIGKGSIKNISYQDRYANNIDKIYDIASQIEPDGGLPGNSEEERIMKTIEALFEFIESGSNSNSGPLKLHIQKIVEFLKNFVKRYKIIYKVIDVAELKIPLPKSWKNVKVGKNFWIELEKLFNNATN